MKLHHIVLAACVAWCIYSTYSCNAITRAGIPVAVGTGAAVVLVGSGVPFVVAVVAASGTWVASAVVDKIDPPVTYVPPAPAPSFFDPWHLMRWLAGWAVLVTALWLISKRIPAFRHVTTAATLGMNKVTAAVVDARRRKKPSPLKNVVVEEKPHP